MTNLSKSAGLATLAEQIRAEHAACESSARTALRHAITAGRLLTEAKDRLGHGKWLPWLVANCAFSGRTAQVYMRAAHHATELEANAQSAAHLTLDGAMKLLAEPAPAKDSPAATAPADDDLVPPAGHCLSGAADNLGGTMTAYIYPSNHRGYYYVSCLFETSDDGPASVDGLKGPIRQDHIRDALDLMHFPRSGARWSTQESDPHDHNVWLFDSHQSRGVKAKTS